MTDTEFAPPVVVLSPPSAWGRPILSALTLVVLLVAAVFGGDPFRIRERLLDPGAGGSAAAAVQPWQSVVTLAGVGTTTSTPFLIDHAAAEWRVKWSCHTGHLLLETAGISHAVVDGACPGPGIGLAAQTGVKTFRVTADGPWQLDVEQRVPVSRAGHAPPPGPVSIR